MQSDYRYSLNIEQYSVCRVALSAAVHRPGSAPAGPGEYRPLTMTSISGHMMTDGHRRCECVHHLQDPDVPLPVRADTCRCQVFRTRAHCGGDMLRHIHEFSDSVSA